MKNELNQRCIMDMDTVLPTERELAVYVLVDIINRLKIETT